MFKEKIQESLEKSIKKLENKNPELRGLKFLVEKSKDKNHGNYSTNIALQIARITKENPQTAAEAIKLEIENQKPDFLEKTQIAVPGFINFWIKKESLEKAYLDFIKNGQKIFQKKLEKKETIVIEYSSPNIAKPLGIHHLRTTVIGQALVNILRFYGHKVISLSYPGDWGTQFGFLISAYKRWGSKEKLKKNPIMEMLDLYVKFSSEAKQNQELINEGRQEFKKLEQGDKENRKIWRWFLKESLKDFNRTYNLLGVKIENTIGESYYEPELKKLVQGALKKGIAKKGEGGAIVIELPNSDIPEIIQKSDGATIYTTRELASIIHRQKKWKATKIFYVAANQQTFHLSQVFGAALRLGIAKPGQLIHIKFGMMLGQGGKKFATREGRLIPLEDVLEESIQRAKKIIDELNPSLPENQKKEIAKDIGVGAIKFFDLSHNRLSDIIFDWDKMLNLKGFSAPYIQYTFARLNSILKKAGFKKKNNAVFLLINDLEKEIAGKILSFDEVIKDISQNYYTDKLTEYLYDLAKNLNFFYEKFQIIKSPNQKEKESRLYLIFGAKEILRIGLLLLGINTPEKM